MKMYLWIWMKKQMYTEIFDSKRIWIQFDERNIQYRFHHVDLRFFWNAPPDDNNRWHFVRFLKGSKTTKALRRREYYVIWNKFAILNLVILCIENHSRMWLVWYIASFCFIYMILSATILNKTYQSILVVYEANISNNCIEISINRNIFNYRD